MIENAAGKALLAASALGDIPSNISRFVSGDLDVALGCLGFFKTYGRHAQAAEDLASVKPFVDRCKQLAAQVTTNIAGNSINPQIEAGKKSKPFIDPALARKLRDMNRPAPEGTVAQLSEKYGKSLSEIRRLKREGRLGELEADLT